MRKRVLKSIIAVLAILTLTLSDFLVLGVNISYALDGLEDQNTKVNSQIDFDVYFKEGENKIHTKTNSIKNGGSLYLNLNVKDSGVLNDAKITMQNSNFDIEKTENKSIKNIDYDNKIIELNPIQYGNNIEIELPIKFNKQSNIELSYFDREIDVELSGKYVDLNNKESDISSTIKVKSMWTEETDVILETQVSKYILLNDSQSLLEQDVISTVKENTLPKEKEKITINIPQIQENLPSDIIVLKNGLKLNNEVEYNKEEKTLNINSNNAIENKVLWNNGKDTYKIIYIYDTGLSSEGIKISTTTSTKLCTKDEEITKNDVKDIDLEKKGEIASIEVSTTSNVYKGYMYAKAENETTYMQKYNIEISNTDNIETIEISSEGDRFVTEAEKELSTNNSTYFKEIQINKENLQRIFGNHASVKLQDKNGTDITLIDTNTQTDENGNIVLKKTDEAGNKIDLQLEDIKIVTSKPVTEGILEITAKKAIKGNTGYDKQLLKTVNKLESTIKVKTSKGEEIAKTQMELKDTKTQAKLEISNNNLSTLEENKGVQITATLTANSSEYDLYKNPKLQIILPNEIEKMKITSAKVLYNEGFKTTENKIETNENGNKVIKLEFEGEQTTFGNDVAEGMQIVIFADITLNKLTPSKKTNIQMIYTNENGNEAGYEETQELNINSKNGVLTYSNISGFNNSGDTLETLSNEIPTGNLDINAEAKTVVANMCVINNYENEISEAVILGKIPGTSDGNIGEQTLAGTFETSLVAGITTSLEGAKVYYSEDVNANLNSDSWKETSENAKAYKIVLPNDELKSGEKIEFGYKFIIPENLSYNQNTYTNFQTIYTYAGQSVTSNSTTILETQKKESEEKLNLEKSDNEDVLVGTRYKALEAHEISDNKKQVVEIADGVEAIITAYSGEDYLENNASLHEGQNVKYTVTINNNSGKDINNLKLVAKHSNVTFYGIEIVKMGSNDYDEDGHKILIDTNWYVLKPEEKNKTFSAEKIENGTSKEFTYEFQVNSSNEGDSRINGLLNINSDEFSKEITLNTIEVEEGKIALSLLKNNYIEFPYQVDYPESIKLTIKNLSNSTVENQKINIPLNKQVTISSVVLNENNEEVNADYKIENDQLSINVSKLNATESKDIYIEFIINQFDGGYMDLTLEAIAQLDNVKYYSNKFIEGVKFNLSKLAVSQKTNNENTMLNKEEEFDVTLSITNNAEFTDAVTISKIIPKELSLVKVIKNGEEQEVEENTDLINSTDKLEPNQTLEYIYTFKVKSSLYDSTSVTVNFDIFGNSYYEKTQDIYYNLNNQLDEDNADDNFNSDDDNIGDKKDEIQDPSSVVEKDDEINGEDPGTEEKDNYTISGKVWVDANKDGSKEETEELLSGIKVFLLKSETGEIVKINNQDLITTTNQGIYQFNNIPEGNYLVAFEYDSNNYRVTTYKKDGVKEEENSDVIIKKINIKNEEKMYAVTDNLSINKSVSNINAGFIKNEKFDLRLDKYVSKIIVQNNVGTTVKTYENTKLAKVEIHRKQLANSTVIIEYTINITNEGELAGYVGDLIDYIPKDLTFSSEINKDWYISTDGYLHNITLADSRIDPGKNVSLTLTLTKTMTNNNTGTTINTAEIGKTSNSLSINDIDSTPANKVETEDDYGKAEVIISIGTGAEVYITIFVILIILMITGGSIYFIKKRKEREDEDF